MISMLPCPICGEMLRLVSLPLFPQPEPKALLKCIACQQTRPWGIFDPETGASICVACAAMLEVLPPFNAETRCPMCSAPPSQISTTACPGSMLVEGTICEGSPIAEEKHVHRQCRDCKHEFLQQASGANADNQKAESEAPR